MTKEIPFFNADKFEWEGSHGRSTFTKLDCGTFTRCFCISPKTGAIKEFNIDTQCPGYEDHWDGEFVKLVDSDRKIFLTVTAD